MSRTTYSDVLFGPTISGGGDENLVNSNESSPKRSEQAEDVRQRIQVGWQTTKWDVNENIDRNVAEFSSKLGVDYYNFVVYPIGGVKRGFFEISPGKSFLPPKIDLPDRQLANHLWETYFCGRISDWIDCDSENEEIAKLSEQELLTELNYVSYLGLRTIIIPLRRKNCPNFQKIVNKWLWTKFVTFNIWILLPSSPSKLLDFESIERPTDIWTIWADFRKSCSNYMGSKLLAVLSIGAELEDEMVEGKLIDRWRAEPLGAIFVDSDAFVSGRDGAELSQAHATTLQRLWASDNLRIVLNSTNDVAKYNKTIRAEYTRALRFVVRDVTWRMKKEAGITDGFLATYDSNCYHDVLQAPLQPLADNLESGVYNTFEQDPIKYRLYKDAVRMALTDFGEASSKPESVFVYLLGAGRGPLATVILEAEKLYNDEFRAKKNRLKVKLYVVEKNTNAIVTLRYMNDIAWKNRVTIIESDMRSLPEIAREKGYEKPDIIVSELLGSFGDNELSPECLDGVTEFLKPTTISIPEKYTSYAAPISSLYLHQCIISPPVTYFNKGMASHSRNQPELEADGTWVQKYPQTFKTSRLDQIYVVYLKQFCKLAETKPVFVFNHPNFENATNERSDVVEFRMDRAADLMGFAGYFDAVLYKNVTMSIEPSTISTGMISWFPAVIPLRELHRVGNGDKVRFFIDRKVDNNGVWYEWCVEIEKPDGQKTRSILQNVDGESYYMRK